MKKTAIALTIIMCAPIFCLALQQSSLAAQGARGPVPMDVNDSDAFFQTATRAGIGARVAVWKKASLSLTSIGTGPLAPCAAKELCCKARQKIGAHIIIVNAIAVFFIVIRYFLA